VSAHYVFVEVPQESGSCVLDWFRNLTTPPEEIESTDGHVLYFREFGALAYDPEGKIDAERSPIVTLHLPQIRRGVLWTVGEVNFRSTNIRSVSPRLEAVHKAFRRWLAGFDLVFENRQGVESPLGYYLEGSSKNWGSGKIYALPSGLAALQRGQYFVSSRDHNLETVCRTLRLRGVDCAD
jgi:hypothetical protein